MKMTTIDSGVLTGQGGSGSVSVGVSNPAPGVGPASGTDGDMQMQIPAGAAQGGATMPATYPLSGSSTEPDSQYDTIDPIPEG